MWPNRSVESLCCVRTWLPWNLSFRYIHCTGQFTPKMKANTESHLLSSLVWIDSGRCGLTALLGVFFQGTKCNGMTNFIEFMWSSARHSTGPPHSVLTTTPPCSVLTQSLLICVLTQFSLCSHSVLTLFSLFSLVPSPVALFQLRPTL